MRVVEAESAVLEAVATAAAGIDPEGRITTWNALAEESTGIAAATAIGKPLSWFYDFFEPHRDSREALARARAGQAVEYEGRLVAPGAQHPWLVSSLRSIVVNGRVGGFVETWRDATRAGGVHARLIEVERLARLGTWEWDVQRDHIVWSDGLYAIYGIAPEDFDPRYAAREQRVHPDDVDRVEATMSRALATGADVDVEYRIIRTDGRIRTLRGRAEVIFDAEGRPIRMFGTAQDVTEVRAAEEALEQTAIELGRRAAELKRVTKASTNGTPVEALLSSRQLEVLALVAEGMTNADIADRLYVSESTVKWHMRQILARLGVSNRAQAVARYLAVPEN